MFGIYRVTHEQRQMLRSLKLQGAYGQEAMTQMRKEQIYSGNGPRNSNN